MARTYRELLVWQKAKTLAVAVYRATESFPRQETFGLTAQMRSAAVSIPSNIAEGQGRGSKPDFAKFLCMARGSLLALETQIEIATELKYGKSAELQMLADDCYEVLGLLNRLLNALSAKSRS